MSTLKPSAPADALRLDPFAEVGNERTFVMPNPGARAAAARPAAAQAGSGEVAQDFPAVPVGLNPLVSLANSVLALVPQLRATTHHVDPAQLKERIAHAIREFERRARAEGIAAERVMAARYVLCTLIDEVAGSTPWGGSGGWARQSLLVAFHNEAWGGEKVFQLMARLAENVKGNADLLELIYACLALGFQGRYRVIEGGPAQLEQVRERLAQLLSKARGDYARPLSQHWQPAVKARSAMTSWLPVVVVTVAVAALLAALYFGLAVALGNASDPVYRAITAIRLPPPAPPVAAPLPAAPPRLAQFLAEEIRAGLVAVRDEPDRSMVTIRGDGLFEPGAALLSDNRGQLMERIGAALAQSPGMVIVSGHTDDQPIRSAKYPSNWHLSQSRADTVRTILLRQGVTPERVRAEGRADSEPLAANDTPANRALNRRVDILLLVNR